MMELDEPDVSDIGPRDCSLAEQRTRHEIRAPKRYQDHTPQPSAALPPPLVLPTTITPNEPQFLGVQNENDLQTAAMITQQILWSPRNDFGLIHQYFGVDFPLHDPEEHNNLGALSDIHSSSATGPGSEPGFGPYPNHSSFALGEWYWCNGVQKSKANFKNLS